MTGRERRALRLLIDEARRERVRREQGEGVSDVGRNPYWRAYYTANREKIRARRNAHNAAQPQKGGRR